MSPFHIVLFNPEIPPNTGNIMRLCANTNCILHIIEPISFEINAKSLRRAGMDYLKDIKINYYEDLDNFILKNKFNRFFLVSKFGRKAYHEIKYELGDFLVFGSESKGFTKELLKKFMGSEKVCIPMANNSRSINLSNAVSIIVYEALRQNNFQFLSNEK